MWELIGKLAKKIKKYRNEIAIGTASIALPFAFGCESQEYGRRGLTLLDVQGNLCHREDFYGENRYTKYVIPATAQK